MRRNSENRAQSSLIGFFFAFTLMCGLAHASPWNREDNRLFVDSRAEYFSAQGGPPIGPNGDVTRFTRFETNDYAEFGLTDDFMIGGKIAYGLTHFSNGLIDVSSEGFSQVEAFIQYQIVRGAKQVLAVKLNGARPAAFDDGVRPGAGDDGPDLSLAGIYGITLRGDPFKVFGAVEAGYRRRFGDSADQFRADILIGAEPARDWLFLAETFSTISLRNESGDGADYDIVKVQGSAVWRFSKRWSVQAGVNKEIIGRNLLLGRTVFIGLWSEF